MSFQSFFSWSCMLFFFIFFFPSIYFVFCFCVLSVIFFLSFQHSQAPMESQKASWHPSIRYAPTYDSVVDLLIHSWDVFILFSSLIALDHSRPFGSHGGLLWLQTRLRSFTKAMASGITAPSWHQLLGSDERSWGYTLRDGTDPLLRDQCLPTLRYHRLERTGY